MAKDTTEAQRLKCLCSITVWQTRGALVPITFPSFSCVAVQLVLKRAATRRLLASLLTYEPVCIRTYAFAQSSRGDPAISVLSSASPKDEVLPSMAYLGMAATGCMRGRRTCTSTKGVVSHDGRGQESGSIKQRPDYGRGGMFSHHIPDLL